LSLLYFLQNYLQAIKGFQSFVWEVLCSIKTTQEKLLPYLMIDYYMFCCQIELMEENKISSYVQPWRRGLVVSSPPSTEEIGALSRQIKARV
jgi:hypothetical protein